MGEISGGSKAKVEITGRTQPRNLMQWAMIHQMLLTYPFSTHIRGLLSGTKMRVLLGECLQILERYR